VSESVSLAVTICELSPYKLVRLLHGRAARRAAARPIAITALPMPSMLLISCRQLVRTWRGEALQRHLPGA